MHVIMDCAWIVNILCGLLLVILYNGTKFIFIYAFKCKDVAKLFSSKMQYWNWSFFCLGSGVEVSGGICVHFWPNSSLYTLYLNC